MHRNRETVIIPQTVIIPTNSIIASLLTIHLNCKKEEELEYSTSIFFWVPEKKLSYMGLRVQKLFLGELSF